MVGGRVFVCFRLSADVYDRVEIPWSNDPLILFRALTMTAAERTEFFKSYLDSCKKCKHFLCGRRLLLRGVTVRDLDNEVFLGALKAAVQDAPLLCIAGVERLHAGLRAAILTSVSKRRDAAKAFRPQMLLRWKNLFGRCRTLKASFSNISSA